MLRRKEIGFVFQSVSLIPMMTAFEHVEFSYDGERKILKDVNFELKSGNSIAIVGPSGSGKSTIINLIPRLYDVDEGEVLVDGVNVKEYSLENLREGVGMVLQKNVLFSGTIKDNLKWGDENATDEEIINAHRLLAEKFPNAEIDLLYVSADEAVNRPVLKQLSTNIFTAQFNYRKYD